MKVIRNEREFILQSRPYKIYVPVEDGGRHSYMCTLPSPIPFILDIGKSKNLLFYKDHKNKLYISDPKYFQYLLPDYKLFGGSVSYNFQGGYYFLILPKKYFGSMILRDEPNYIVFQVDCLRRDFRGFLGVIGFKIIHDI